MTIKVTKKDLLIKINSLIDKIELVNEDVSYTPDNMNFNDMEKKGIQEQKENYNMIKESKVLSKKIIKNAENIKFISNSLVALLIIDFFTIIPFIIAMNKGVNFVFKSSLLMGCLSIIGIVSFSLTILLPIIIDNKSKKIDSLEKKLYNMLNVKSLNNYNDILELKTYIKSCIEQKQEKIKNRLLD